MKRILILSPQSWSHQRISKHHYAEEFARIGEVFFLNPPVFSKKPNKSIQLDVEKLPGGISLISYYNPLSKFIKFKLTQFYLWKSTRALSHKINQALGEFDLIIDFGYQRDLTTLECFKAETKIFFPVDFDRTIKVSTRGCHKFFSVSENIIDQFAKEGIKMNFIHHGLSSNFLKKSQELLSDTQKIRAKKSDKFEVAYSGNLCIPFLDRVNFIKTIEGLKDIVVFNLYGNYSPLNEQDTLFINRLKSMDNVKLWGKLDTHELAHKLSDNDAFWICYESKGNYSLENTHKLMEYLSLGKPIVSSPLNSKNLRSADISICYGNNESHLKIFQDLLSDSPKLLIQNMKFAQSNSYEVLVKRIIDA